MRARAEDDARVYLRRRRRIVLREREADAVGQLDELRREVD